MSDRKVNAAVAQLADALGVPRADVEQRLGGLLPGRAARLNDKDERALAILGRALGDWPLRIEDPRPGRPFIIKLRATGPVAIGHGLPSGELLEDDPDFGALVMRKGDSVDAAVFSTASRSARMATFDVRVPAERRALFATAFFILVDEGLVWNAHSRELRAILKSLEADRKDAENFRRLAENKLRLRIARGPSDWDLEARVGPIPPTRKARR